MDPLLESGLIETRRHFFSRSAAGIGTAALASLANPQLFADSRPTGGLPDVPHFAARAKRHLPVHVRGTLSIGYVGLQT